MAMVNKVQYEYTLGADNYLLVRGARSGGGGGAGGGGSGGGRCSPPLETADWRARLCWGRGGGIQ